MNGTEITWTIRPAEFLGELGWQFRKRGNWLDVKICPNCRGGDHGDTHTFAVHAADGNFICLRSGCGIAGNFWRLVEMGGRDPRDYIAREGIQAGKPAKRKKKKGFIYGR